MQNCPLCRPEAEAVLWSDTRLRVILVSDADYPAFCRVIWNEHVKEMTDLADADRSHLVRVALVAEEVLRAMLQPDKINLASLGNQVPHLHWHVIPRFVDDAHFPDPVWGPRNRQGHPHALEPERLRSELIVRLGASSG